MREVMDDVEHRPWPLPDRRWRMRQRWSKLLFAHWPVPAEEVQRRLPAGLKVDTFDGWAWLGVVPFLMDRVRVRAVGDASIGIPGTTAFPELNLRTYVRGPDGRAGVYFFSLDAGSLLAVIGARMFFGLPYFWARMKAEEGAGGAIRYTSRRIIPGGGIRFEGQYRPLGEVYPPSMPGSLEYFLTERYALYVSRFGQVRVGEIHHRSWPLERAEAEFAVNELPAAFGFALPEREPVLHYAAELEVVVWGLRA